MAATDQIPEHNPKALAAREPSMNGPSAREHSVFARIVVGLAAGRAEHKTIMIDVSSRTQYVRESLRKYLRASRTASSPRILTEDGRFNMGMPP